ncbi:MAG: aspartate/glutamate racemase family protein [Caldilineaceae bacterium]|nr:aspartate/glutamate racemase family protein [Caldilineaceae bacterium]
MPKKLALIHTATVNATTIGQLCKEAMPDVEVFHIVDESLLKNTIEAQKLTPTTYRRLAHYLEAAEAAGADAILVTCSSIGPAVDAGRALVNVPVLRIDQAMAEEAVRLGTRIGVIATLSTTLEPTAALVQASATAQGKTIEIITALCTGAFDAVISGDTATHDRLVLAGLKNLMDQVDVIVLAQATMARVVDSLPMPERRVPILASPRLGVAAVRAVMATL